MRLGIDLGGTKIEGAVLDATGAIIARKRIPTPGDYDGVLEALADLVGQLSAAGELASIGIGMPGSISPRDGMARNSNTTFINGMPFQADVETALGRPVKLENDANCFALSEAVDGAAAGAKVVFGAILGTGCGGGLVVEGKVLKGANGIGGEWGHVSLPWSRPEEHPGPRCWCGRPGCIETFLSGKAFERDYTAHGGPPASAPQIVALARGGEMAAKAALERYVDRLGRALAMVCDIADPDVIVLGGGMSNVDELYEAAPAVTARHAFSDSFVTRIVKARHGDSSGVRGAAWL
jgi:fructokinase